MLLNQAWVHSLTCSKANPLTVVVPEESTVFIAGHLARRTGCSSSKGPRSQVAFREGFKGGVREAVSGVCDRLVHNSWIGWHQGEVFSIINPWVSTTLGSVFLWSAVFIWWGPVSYKNNLGMCQAFVSFRELSSVVLLCGRFLI